VRTASSVSRVRQGFAQSNHTGLPDTHRLARGILIAANYAECGRLEPRSVGVWNPGVWASGTPECGHLEPLILAGVSEYMAQDFISYAGADWMMTYVTDESDGLGWRFSLSSGNAKFRIERAIIDCVRLVKQFVDNPGTDVAEGFRVLTDRLRYTVRCSVATANGGISTGGHIARNRSMLLWGSTVFMSLYSLTKS
jgi:hypothetical protein